VVKGKDGKIREEFYRAGTPDGKVPPGLYAAYLRRTIQFLERARAVADPEQAQVIADLVRFYQTGESKDWLTFGADWVRNDAVVDFANGFIEVYRDARGAKGSSQSFITITDKPVTDAMTKLAQNAAYFEQKAPWDAKYKKQSFQPPVVKAVEALIETGDFHVTTIGVNLPNENQIREEFGSKNFLLLGSSHAISKATAGAVAGEFAATSEEAERTRRFGEDAEDMLTAMHEVIGHGSGKLTDRLKEGAQPYLKEYYSTLEEARADLMGLYNVWDPKLKELGLLSDQESVARAMYDSAARVSLTQLRRIPKGETIEEDHQRGRALIANYVKDRTGAIEQFGRDGKTYIGVKDYQKMREGVAQLLGELMRIKAEGDYGAVKALIDQYGVRFDPKVRDQVVARYKQLNLPTYWAGINPELTADLDADGALGPRSVAGPWSLIPWAGRPGRRTMDQGPGTDRGPRTDQEPSTRDQSAGYTLGGGWPEDATERFICVAGIHRYRTLLRRDYRLCTVRGVPRVHARGARAAERSACCGCAGPGRSSQDPRRSPRPRKVQSDTQGPHPVRRSAARHRPQSRGGRLD
jgi:dipeptidyl-peptidase-3